MRETCGWRFSLKRLFAEFLSAHDCDGLIIPAFLSDVRAKGQIAYGGVDPFSIDRSVGKPWLAGELLADSTNDTSAARKPEVPGSFHPIW